MAKKKKRPRDLNRLAFSIVEEAVADPEEQADSEDREKDPLAVELGRRGGLKGGKAYAEKLTPEERTERARKAALARWSRVREETD